MTTMLPLAAVKKVKYELATEIPSLPEPQGKVKPVNRYDRHLRCIGPDDEAEVHRLLCVPEVYEYLADGAEPPPSITSDWISTAAADLTRNRGGLWALTCPRERGILGLVRLSDDAKGELELIYLLHPGIWGVGYATRMARTAMNHAFGTGSVSSIWAGAGVEYVIEAAAFDGDRIELLSIISE